MEAKIQNLFVALAIFAGINHVAAQGATAFTYQGQLHDTGTNANGTYTMIFKLYDANSSGNQVGSTLATGATLANGLFSVNLDFGSVFDGNARWLDITVTNGGVTQTLSPRLQVLPTPYAQFSAVAATVTNGAIMNAQLAVNAVATANLQNSAVIDAKIVSVSGSKVSGAVASASYATSAGSALSAVLATTAGSAASAVILTNGIWNVSVGSYQSQNGGPFLTDSLLFSAQGMVQALFSPGSGLFGFFGDITCYTNKPNAIRLNGSGATITGDGNGGMLVYNPVASGSVDINVGGLTASGNITASSMNAGAFYTTSDRNLKEKFTSIDNQEILERVTSLPISSWNFKQDAATRHIGPMAQDFYAAFKVGTDDKHIATVDEDGVALAAIQGLNEKLKEKDAQIEALNKRLADLEQFVKTPMQK